MHRNPVASLWGPWGQRLWQPRQLALIGAAGMLLLVGQMYVRCLPSTVQGLDSGELVSHAFALQVPHPPGFPAYVWLTHAMVVGWPWGSVFWRASLGAALCALVGLVALFSVSLRREADGLHLGGAAAGLVLPLGLERLFWLYAITPDVFALHVATTAVALAAFLGLRAGVGRAVVVSGAFALGMANHSTTIFWAPLWIASLVDLPDRRRGLWLAAGVGLGVAALYATLCAMHPHALDSWGVVDSLPRLWRHVIRADYGLLQLDGHSQSAQPLKNWGLLVAHIAWGTPISCVLIVFACYHMRGDARLRLVLCCLAVYCVAFFSLANTDDKNILERFMLMPHVGMIGAGVYAWSLMPAARWRRLRTAGVVLACAMTLWQLPHTLRNNDLSRDTVVEDYAINLLHMPVDSATSVIVTDDDTRFNALRYAQNVLGVRPDILVLTLGTALSSFGIDKLHVAHPAFVIAPISGDSAASQSFYRRVMRPNQSRYTFYFTPNVKWDGFRTTYMGLGRALNEGQGVSLDGTSLQRLQWRGSPQTGRMGTPASVAEALWRDYCIYYQAAAHYADSPQAMQQALAAGVVRMPQCRQVLTAMCAGLKEAQACRQQLAAL